MFLTTRLRRAALSFATTFLLPIVLLMPLAVALAADQRWAVTYDSGRLDQPAAAVTVDNSGNAYVAGSSYDGTHSHYKVVKYDANGNPIWNTTASYSAGSDDIAKASAMDSTAAHLWVTGSVSTPDTYPYPATTITPDATTVGLWHFDENTGVTTAADSSGNNNTGTFSATGSNLLVNPGFESATGGVPDNWAIYGTGTSANVDTSIFHGGAQSLQLAFDGTSSDYGRQQVISVTSGVSYTLSGWLKNSMTDAGKYLACEVYALSPFSIAYMTDYGNGGWNFGSTTFSSSGNVTVRCHGFNTPAGTAWVDDLSVVEARVSTFSGKFSKAIALRGTGNVSVPRTASLSFNNTSAFTTEAWFMFPTSNDLPSTRGIYAGLFQQCDSGGACNSGVAPLGRTWLGVDTTNHLYSTIGNTTLTGQAVTYGVWYHAAVTYNNGVATLYLDGAQQGSVSAPLENSTGDYRIGSGKSDGYTSGYIDEVSVWNVAEAPATIAAHAGRTVVPGINVGWTTLFDASSTSTPSATCSAALSATSTQSEAVNVVVDSAGNAYVTGRSKNVSGNWDFRTVKYSGADCIQLWAATYDSGADDTPVGIGRDGAGNTYVAGYSSGAVNGFTIVKYDASGNQAWTRIYPANGVASAMAVDGAGNVYVTGRTSSAGNSNFLTVKYDASGTLIWAKIWDNGPNDAASAILLDSSGNAYVAGRTYRSTTVTKDDDYAIVKYNSADGAQLWARTYDGGNGYDEATSLIISSDNKLYVSGRSANGSGSWDYVTLKYTLDGSLIVTPATTANRYNTNYDTGLTPASAVAAPAFAVAPGYVYLAGGHFNGADDDFALVKYGIDTDDDGLPDEDETNIYHTNPNNPDTDGDGLTDYEEIFIYHTDPLNPDTDGDGLTDGYEVHISHTDPLKADTDGDGLTDGYEVNISHTDPLNPDTDGDGAKDGYEVSQGSDPNNAASRPVTTDLYMSNVSVTQGNAVAGSNITINYTVVNEGQGTGAGFNIAFYLSPDSTITGATGSNDVYFCSAAQGALGGWTSVSGSVTCAIPSTAAPGWYFIGAKADDNHDGNANGSIVEGDETNNALSSTSQIEVLGIIDAGDGHDAIAGAALLKDLGDGADGALNVTPGIVSRTLTKTGASYNWDGGAISSQTLSGDGAFEVTAAETNTARMFGLNNTNPDANYTNIKYAIYLSGTGSVAVYENGTGRGSFGTYAVNDVFRIERTGSTVVYKKNGVVFYTSTVAASGSYFLDTSLYTPGATIKDAKIIDGSGTNWVNWTSLTTGSLYGVSVTNAGATFNLMSSSSDAFGNTSDGNGAQPDEFATNLAADAARGATSITVGSTAGFVTGDEVLIIQMQGATYAGRYEFKKNITVVDGTHLSFATGIRNPTFNATTGKAQVVRVPNYTNVTMDQYSILTTNAYNSSTGVGGILIFRANGTVTLNGVVNVSGLGFAGGNPGANTTNSKQGDGYPGAGALNSTAANGNGGGAPTSYLSGSGGGGYAAAGGSTGSGAAAGGAAVGDATLGVLFPGGGGGSGRGGNTTSTPGAGGNGGGIIFMTADSFTLTGSIASNGANGAAGVGIAGPGGGGAGGSIYLGANSLTLGANQVTASGGSGNTNTFTISGNKRYVYGGDGAAGRIYLEGAVSGSTTPAAVTGSGATNNIYPSGVINAYAPLAADVAAGATSLTIGAVSGTGSFATGDEILIIQMQHHGGATEFFNDLSKPSGIAGYNAGAISTQSLSGDGAVEFKAGATGLERVFGLASAGSSPGISYTNANYQYAIRLYTVSGTSSSDPTFAVYEGGIFWDIGAYAAGDVFRIERSNCAVSCTVTYYKNGAAFRTVTGTYAGALIVDTSLYTVSATPQISEAKIITGAAAHAITWTSLTNVTVSSTITNPAASTTNAGKYEFRKNISVSGSTISFATGLANGYYGGANGKTQIVRVPNYADFAISTDPVNALAYNSSTGTGGIVAFRANGTVAVNGAISVNGLGFAGGNPGTLTTNSKQGDGELGAGALNNTGANGNGGGGGLYASAGNYGGGGGGGYAAPGAAGSGSSSGTPGDGGAQIGDAALSLLFIGGGGGSGAANSTSYTAGAGGNGGGMVFVAANTLRLGTTGAISSNGANGVTASGLATSGGGGAGGSVYLGANTATVASGQLSVNAGAGGAGGIAGGNGAAGRIYLQVYNDSGVALPDLVMSAVSVPASAVNGSTITIANTVLNQRSTAAGPFRIGFYLSTDANITLADTFLGSRTVASLAGGASDAANTAVTLPAGISGNYYIGAIVDDLGAVVEMREDNNARVANIAGNPSGTTVSVTTGTSDKAQGGGGGAVQEGDLALLIAYGVILGLVRRRETGRGMKPARIIIVLGIAVVAVSTPSVVSATGGLLFNFEQQGPTNSNENNFSSCGPGMLGINCQYFDGNTAQPVPGSTPSAADLQTSFLRELINGWWHIVVIDPSGGFRQETYIKVQALASVNQSYSEAGGGVASLANAETDAFTNSNANPYQVIGNQDNFQVTGNGTGNPNVVAIRQEVQTGDTTSIFQKGGEGVPLDYNSAATRESLAQKPVIGQTVDLSDAQATGSLTFLLDMRNSHYNQGGIAGYLTNRLVFSGAGLPDGTMVWDQAVNGQLSYVTGGQYTYTPGLGWGSSISNGQDFKEGAYTYTDGFFNLHDDWTPFCNPASECQ